MWRTSGLCKECPESQVWRKESKEDGSAQEWVLSFEGWCLVFSCIPELLICSFSLTVRILGPRLLGRFFVAKKSAIHYKELECDCLENYRKGSYPSVFIPYNTVETRFLGLHQDLSGYWSSVVFPWEWSGKNLILPGAAGQNATLELIEETDLLSIGRVRNQSNSKAVVLDVQICCDLDRVKELAFIIYVGVPWFSMCFNYSCFIWCLFYITVLFLGISSSL